MSRRTPAFYAFCYADLCEERAEDIVYRAEQMTNAEAKAGMLELSARWRARAEHARVDAAAIERAHVHVHAPIVRLLHTLLNRWANTREGSPHRIIDDADAAVMRAALDLAEKEIA